MAGNWLDPNQYPHQQSAAYQYPAQDYAQQAMYQQNAGYNAAAYQQHYAQQYAAAQGYQQQAWAQGQYQQYPQQYPQQASWTPAYPAQQYPPSFQQPQYQPQQLSQHAPQHASTSWPGHTKGVSCYNCGGKNHWATVCPQPSRSAFGSIGPVAPIVPSAVAPAASYPTQLPGGHKGPVVTKYAVPPHVAAQMKARGIQGATSVEANAPGLGYGAQYSSWQQWQAQVASSTTYQAHSGVQESAYPQTSPPHASHVQIPPTPAVIQPQLAGSPIKESYASHVAKDTSAGQSPSSTAQPNKTANHPEVENENQSDEEDDDDLGLLDVPDMPGSYGTSAYDEPKLLAKPLYALAPEWLQAGFGEVTLCEDPNGRTVSDYVDSGEPDAVLKDQRTPAHDVDPIFATIDIDSPITKEGRSGSRDSCKTGYETPLTFDSAETLPTSIEDTDESFQHGQGRVSALSKPNKNRPLLDSEYTGHLANEGSSNFLQDKKRKHEHGDDDSISDPNDTEPDVKKVRSEG